jgi:hypothetical protein
MLTQGSNQGQLQAGTSWHLAKQDALQRWQDVPLAAPGLSCRLGSPTLAKATLLFCPPLSV